MVSKNKTIKITPKIKKTVIFYGKNLKVGGQPIRTEIDKAANDYNRTKDEKYKKLGAQLSEKNQIVEIIVLTDDIFRLIPVKRN